jgi:hypothetical protein
MLTRPRAMTVSRMQQPALPRLIQLEHGIDLSHRTFRSAHGLQLFGALCVDRKKVCVQSCEPSDEAVFDPISCDDG